MKFSYLFTHRYLSLAPFIGFDIAFTKVENTLKQRRDKVVSTLFQRCFNVVSTSGTDVVSTLYNVENLTSDFVSFSTSDQRYFNVDPNVETTLIRR